MLTRASIYFFFFTFFLSSLHSDKTKMLGAFKCIGYFFKKYVFVSQYNEQNIKANTTAWFSPVQARCRYPRPAAQLALPTISKGVQRRRFASRESLKAERVRRSYFYYYGRVYSQSQPIRAMLHIHELSLANETTNREQKKTKTKPEAERNKETRVRRTFLTFELVQLIPDWGILLALNWLHQSPPRKRARWGGFKRQPDPGARISASPHRSEQGGR